MIIVRFDARYSAPSAQLWSVSNCAEGELGHDYVELKFKSGEEVGS